MLLLSLSFGDVLGNVHSLQLLDCNNDLPMLLLAVVARLANREGLTPLRLHGRTLEGDLGRCRSMPPFLPLLLNAALVAPYSGGGQRR